MTAVAQLLDKVRNTCSLPSDAALAERLGITRQTIHCWRHGIAFPNEDHVARMAGMAHEDPGAWLLKVKAESSTGAAGKAWAALAKRLGAAAAVLLMVGGLAPSPAAAKSLTYMVNSDDCILCQLRDGPWYPRTQQKARSEKLRALALPRDLRGYFAGVAPVSVTGGK